MNIFIPYLLTSYAGLSVDGISFLMTTLVVIAFFIAWGINRISVLRIRRNSERVQDMSAIMMHTLSLSGDSVIKLSLADRYAINVQGNFLPPEGMSFEESKKYVHPDDWHFYEDFLKELMRGKKTAECNFRWNISKDKDKVVWRNIHNQGVAEYANEKLRIPTNLFCTISDNTETVVQAQEENKLTDKYRKIFEQSIVGLAFYDKDGYLLTVNQKMRDILKFQSEDDPYYFGNTIYEMPTFKEVLNNRHIEELWFCTKSVIVERGVNCYTELRVHPIYGDDGQLIYIAFSIRDVTQERELYLQNKKNDEHIRQQIQEIQQYETELQYLMESCDMRFWQTSFKDRTITFYKELSKPEKVLTFENFQTYFVDDEGVIARNFKEPEKYFKEPVAYLCHMHPIYHESDELLWNIIDNVPNFDGEGRLIGCYGVIRNVTDLIKKQELLKQETERANDSGRLKSVFMANMTHEIRTPLNSIVGFSDVLPMMSTPEEKQEIIKVIMNNCDMLLRLINDILAVSTLDSNGISIEDKEVDFSGSFDNICQSLAQRVQNPQVKFITENPYKTLTIKIDPDRIQQIITNFVTNAVKYTQEGHIKVGYAYRGNGLYIYCEDTGAGIPKEAQGKVFERFVKLNDYVQGTGLGLSICKAIADRYQGSIGVESEGEGKGSTFWAQIPCEVINNDK